MASLSTQPSKKAMRSPGAGGSSAGSQGGTRNSSGQTVKFARRTSSGRYVSLSRDDLDIVTRAHLMDKVIESEVSHPQMAGAKGSACSMPACDGKVMKDERGADVTPCDCRFKICRDCFLDAQKETGLCPGCKEPYKGGEYDDDDVPDFSSGALSLPAPQDDSKADRRRPLADHPAVKYGRPPGALRHPREPLDAATVAEAVSVISCWYEDKTEWGDRVALVEWDDICLPKKEGGLGFKNLEAWNLALLSRNLWNIQAKKDTLWVRWMHEKYLQNSCIWDYNGYKQDSNLMKHVLNVRDKLLTEEGSIQAAKSRVEQWVINGKFNSKAAYDFFRPRKLPLTWPNLPLLLLQCFLVIKGLLLLAFIDTAPGKMQSSDHPSSICNFLLLQ
ncbi:cellulose synthase like D4 [Actinidia rufa]|uniref:Cellulose synthase like D4 n=1 Tax=Actinidia rufa TaxID=165716 RepID=A0A7J0DLC2_9ERIC|nr:cellulose synthase like D4 [Actinidia rufa]